MRDFHQQRLLMVEQQIAARGVTDQNVLAAMREVPREQFVAEDVRQYAYKDGPIPIEAGQTISQPYVVALMIEAAEVAPGETVLEIGAGSGYAAAVMSRIAARVYAIERHGELVALARERLQRLGYDNVELRAGDGTGGWPEAGPFDAIIASAAGPAAPDVLKEQLAADGVLVMPIGEAWGEQRLVKVKRTGPASYREKDLGAVGFVRLIGEHGWPE
jgi:protein-L-isoaspartate(D-aspartate) O-methyltransferase